MTEIIINDEDCIIKYPDADPDEAADTGGVDDAQDDAEDNLFHSLVFGQSSNFVCKTDVNLN